MISKNTIKNLGQLSIALALFVMIATGCTKSSTGNHESNNNGSPEPTPIGAPIGAAEQVVIGPAGGTFVTSDTRLKLEFPAGALTTQTTISVQPIEDHCPAASGIAYLITPHDIQFKQPVRLTMNYGDSDVINSISAAMTIAYQDTTGVWRAPGNMTKDTANKTVSVLTDHFSGWSLFQAVRLSPISTVVQPGGSVGLSVEKYTDFADDLLVPIPGPLSKKDLIVKDWSLSGEGQLAPNKDLATYTAPSTIPSKNPVAVTATLNTSGTWKFMLVSNIYIGNEGLTFRIDNGPWMHGPSSGAFFNGYYNEFTAANSSTPQYDGVTITWMGDTHIGEFINWGITYPSFLYGEQPNINYTQLLVPSAKPSPGGIYFHQAWKSQATPYVIGTFYLTPAQKTIIVPNSFPQYSTHRIEGFFKIKWQ